MLAQNPIGKCDQPICYASKLLNSIECNYTTPERKAFAMVYVLNKYRHFQLGNNFVFFHHMALIYLVNKPQVFGKIARWFLFFLEYDFTMVYKPGKTHGMADAPSRTFNGELVAKMEHQIADASLFSIQPITLDWLRDVTNYLQTGTPPFDMSKDD
jgi:hypothetical protein